MMQPKPNQNQNQTRPTFLFVNKTQKSKSLSRSDGDDAREINRHAQQMRSRRKEATRITSIRQSSLVARRIALGGYTRVINQLPDENCNDVESSSSSSSSSPKDESNENQFLPVRIVSDNHESYSHHEILNKSHDEFVIQKYIPPIRPFDEDFPARPNYQKKIENRPRLIETSLYDIFSKTLITYEPVGPTPVEISPSAQTALLYMLKIYPYTGNNYKIAFLPQHIRASISQFPIKYVLQQAIQKEAHLYSILAILSQRLPRIHGAPGVATTSDDLRRLATYHIREELMNGINSNNIDKMLILDILLLSVFETLQKNYDASKEHLKVAGKLLHLLDLNQDLDHWISETAHHCDNQFALSTGNLPILKQTFDPGPLLPERMIVLKNEVARLKSHGPKVWVNVIDPSPKTIVASNPRNLNDALADIASTLDTRMGARFKFGLKIGIFQGEMYKIVADLVDCIDLAKVIWLSPIAVCFDAEWLCRKARSILRALLAADRDVTTGPSREKDCCMESLRLTLVMLLTHACTLSGYQTAKGNVRRLQASMRAVLASWTPIVGFSPDCSPPPTYTLSAEDIIETGLGLWALVTGAFVATDMPEEDWFLLRACHLARTLRLYTYEDIDNHMNHYLYSKTLQKGAIYKICDLLRQFEPERFTVGVIEDAPATLELIQTLKTVYV